MSSHHTYPAHAHEAFTKEALARVQAVVAEVEQSTNIELRISIRDLRDSSEAGLSIKELAIREFAQLGMRNTANHVGVMLFVLYDERKFYVLADKGIHAKTSPEHWTDVADTLKSHFHHAEFEAGLIAALRRIEHHCHGILHAKPKSANELSDEVVVR